MAIGPKLLRFDAKHLFILPRVLNPPLLYNKINRGGYQLKRVPNGSSSNTPI